jgi:hypothetical protein
LAGAEILGAFTGYDTDAVNGTPGPLNTVAATILPAAFTLTVPCGATAAEVLIDQRIVRPLTL